MDVITNATTDINVKQINLYDKNYITAQLEHLSHSNVRLFRKVCIKLDEKYFLKYQNLHSKQKL